MGDPQTLSWFVNYTTINFPATYYALILWDHGGGTYGVCWDDSNGHDNLSINEVHSVLSSLTTKVDVLCSDACLMGMTEIYYDFGQVVRPGGYVVGSELTEPGDGYPYDTSLSWLSTNINTATPETFAKAIVDEYDVSYLSYPWGDVTQATIAASDSIILKNSINSFAEAVIAANDSGVNTALATARSSASHSDLDGYDFVDLWTFASNVATANSTINQLSTNIQGNITNLLYYKGHKPGGGTITGIKGVSIYYPKDLTYLDFSYAAKTTFGADSQWDEMLAHLAGTPSGGGEEDAFEENDDMGQATLITIPNTYPLYSADDDYFKFDRTAGQRVDITLEFSDTLADLDLYLAYSDGTVLAQSISGFSLIESVSVESMPITDTYYILVDNYAGVNTPYSLKLTGVADDAFEENDDISTASLINENQLYSDLVAYDDDWYELSASPGDVITVTLNYTYSAGDLNLVLYTGLGTPIDLSDNPTNQESISYYTDTGGTFYARVMPGQNNTNYSLKYTSAPFSDDLYEENDDYLDAVLLTVGTYSLNGLDEDWFEIDLEPGEWLNITLIIDSEEGDLDLWLYDELGYTVAAAFTVKAQENILFSSQWDQNVLLLVNPYEAALDYTLIIEKPTGLTDDAYEDNDNIAEATNLGVVVNGPAVHISAISYDWDFYALNISQFDNLTVELTSSVDPDVVIWNATFDLIEYIGGPGGEDFTIQINTTGLYYILILPYDGFGNYNLTVSLTNPSAPTPTTTPTTTLNTTPTTTVNSTTPISTGSTTTPADLTIPVPGFPVLIFFYAMISLSAIFIIYRYRRYP
ncbi:MAG: clostripain-related cysteine peptidase, partial [Candidatus Hodarchaeota archaeon]